MNETSLCGEKLASRRWSSRLGALGKGSQAARADPQPDSLACALDGYLLHVDIPATPGVALRETDVIAKLWPPLAAESAPVGHIYPLTMAG